MYAGDDSDETEDAGDAGVEVLVCSVIVDG
jgi:hypothetical protein